MAIKKQIEIDVDTKSAVKSMEELGGSFEDVYGEVQPLSGRIGELEDRLYEMAAAGDTSSDEFRQLTKEVGSMKKVIIDTDLAVDGMSQTMAQNVGGALGGLTGAFELGQGAMGAFGVESEAVEETLLKVQSAMAISQGLQTIKESISSFKALGATLVKTAIGQKILTAAQAMGAAGMAVLNAVMAANPVLLIVAGIGALVGALAWLMSDTEKAEEMNEKLNDSFDRTTEALDRNIEKYRERHKFEMEMLKLTGASEEELHNKRLKNLQSEETIRKHQLEVEKTIVAEKRRVYKQALKEGNEDLATSVKEEIAEHRNKYKDLADQHENYNREKKKEDQNYQNHLDEVAKQEAEKEKQRRQQAHQRYKQHLIDRLATKRQIEDRRLGLIKDTLDKQLILINQTADRELEDLKRNTKLKASERAALTEIIEQERLAKISEVHIQEEALELEHEKRLAEQKAALPSFEEMEAPPEELVEVEAEEIKGTAAFGIKQKWEQLGFELKEKWQKKAEESNKEYLDRLMAQSDKSLGHMAQGLQALDDLNTALTDAAVAKAGDNEEAAEAARKKGFERSKKLQLAMAVITGIQGVMAAFTAGSSMGPAGVVMGPLMAALAAITAGANIAKISKMKYEGGASTGGGPVVPPPSPASVPNPANFNVVGDSGTNQLAESLGQQPPVQAYVVGSEVTTQQSLDRNKVETASI